MKMFLIVVIGAILVFAMIDFVGNIKTWLARDMKDVGDYYLSYLPYYGVPDFSGGLVYRGPCVCGQHGSPSRNERDAKFRAESSQDALAYFPHRHPGLCRVL
jgi:hypothetical protein